jgi:glycosyltransferase involved in cell wall biosynthesis
VIPAFNEEVTIGGVVAEARLYAPVLVVDDGSTDRTADEARAAGAVVIAGRTRQGKGAALRVGLRAACATGATWVVTLDGDGQHEPAEIRRLVETARRMPEAVVIGGRLQSTGAMPRGRLNACRVASFFIGWTTGTAIRDTQSGFRCYPTRLFDEVEPRRGGFVLESELLVATARVGRPLVEVPIRASAPGRRSRFHPVLDGGAVGAYIAAGVIGHCLGEARAAAREVGRVFHADRLRARHEEMAEAGARYLDAAHLYGVAIGHVAVRRARDRVLGWWRAPRRQRATLALTGIAVTPLLLTAVVIQPLFGLVGVDLVTPIVDHFYSQERLAAMLASMTDASSRVDRTRARAAADRASGSLRPSC